jgi:hypothetical protein
MVKYKINYKIHQNEYSKVIYGDSVTCDTPIMLRNPKNGMVTFKKIEDIGNSWSCYPGFKMFDTSLFKSSKEYGVTDYQCWTDKGWSDIKKVIRHKTEKQIYRVFTEVGYVKVTEDHSLLDKKYEILKPKQCGLNTELLSRYPNDFQSVYTGLDENNAYVMGMMFADLDYDSVPDEILNGPRECCIEFLRGMDTVDYSRLSEVGMAGIYYLKKKIGERVMLKESDGEISLIKDRWLPNSKIKINEPINKVGDYVYDLETEVGRFQAGIGELIVKNTDSCMIELNTKALVKYKKLVEEYSDVIHLTDIEQKRLDEFKTKAVEEAFVQGKVLAKEVTTALFKHPINLEFEKVYTNFLILSKKRYLGNYHGTNPHTIDFVEKKGVVLKRRDNPEIVKKIYTGVVEPLLEHGKRGIDISVNFLKNELQKLMRNEVDLKDLVITKSLAKGYGKVSENGEVVLGDSDYRNMNLPHVALANKMRDRDPGSAPLIGDRINYIFVEIPDNPKAKLYEKAEDLTVAIDKKLKVDYLYYITNQIHNPVSEIIKILVTDYEKIFTDATKACVKKREEEIKIAKIKKSIPKGQLSILKWIKPVDK